MLTFTTYSKFDHENLLNKGLDETSSEEEDGDANKHILSQISE